MLKVDDFLTKSKKRKPATESSSKKKKKTGSDEDWRGRMTIVLKSPLSATKNDSKKSNLVKESVSTVVSGEDDNFLLFDDTILYSRLLSAEEIDLLDSRVSQFEKANKEMPVITKLVWRDRDGASLLAKLIDGQKEFQVSSGKTEPQTCTVGKSSKRLWLASASSLEKIALANTKGSDMKCIIPKFKGIVRISVNGEISGALKVK